MTHSVCMYVVATEITEEMRSGCVCFPGSRYKVTLVCCGVADNDRVCVCVRMS